MTWQTLVDFYTQWQSLIRIIAIVLGAVLIRAILLALVKRTVKTIENGKSSKVDSAEELAHSPVAKARMLQRAKTLASVLSNLITWTLVLFALGSILGELGIAVGAMVASAGILGAALGFGAQSLVRDLLSGLFIIFEDQFGVGDSVDLGEVKGSIENVGLRVTQIRDVHGVLWYVRNGEIIRVGNHSQGWSRIVLDVPIAYTAKVDKARELILLAATELSKDSKFTKKVIGKPEVWGIENIDGDQIVIRLVQEVGPEHRDVITRELRERIKSKLDGAKISLASTQIFIGKPNK
ncbi:MAG: mechanosensitive ion channel family protein [Micrococcales bacterium]